MDSTRLSGKLRNASVASGVTLQVLHVYVPCIAFPLPAYLLICTEPIAISLTSLLLLLYYKMNNKQNQSLMMFMCKTTCSHIYH